MKDFIPMQTRRLFALLPLAFVALAHAHSATPANPDDAAIDKAVRTTRDAIQQAVLANDAERLQALYTSEFTHTHGSGKVDGRAPRIVSLLTADPTVEMAPIANWELANYSGHTAVVRGTAPILNKKENQYYQFRWIQVYVNGGEGWKMAASQATRLSTAPVPADDAAAVPLRQLSAKPAASPASSAR